MQSKINTSRVRRQNLQYIVESSCSKSSPYTSLAKKMGWRESYARTLADDDSPYKNQISDKVARAIEAGFDLPAGWLDRMTTPVWKKSISQEDQFPRE